MVATRRRPSLRLRITACAVVVVIVALCGAGLLVIRLVEKKMTRQIDVALTADADFTRRAITHGSGLPMGEGPTDLFVQFVASDGRVVGAGTAATGRPALAAITGARAPHISTTHDSALGELRVLVTPVPKNPQLYLVLGRSSADVAAVRRSLVHLLAGLVVIGSAALGWLIWVVVGRALRPVDEMRRTVDALGERDLHRRLVKPGTGDELDGLADTLNDLLGRLYAAVARESQFVADASHELRTPIAAIRVLLETETADPASVVLSRAEAMTQLGHLQELVDDLLVLAKADSGPPLVPQAVDLDELVLGHARQLARATNLRIDTTRVSGGQVAGRDIDLDRLVENLATNAARYATTTVAFAVQQFDDCVELIVADDGPGIPDADRSRVFERFGTLEDVAGSARSGAGLGLSIVAAIVELHGGSIRVDRTEGGGARFVVRLPAFSTESNRVRPDKDRRTVVPTPTERHMSDRSG